MNSLTRGGTHNLFIRSDKQEDHPRTEERKMKDRKGRTGNEKEKKRGRRWCVRELSYHPAYHTKNYHNFEAYLFYLNYLACFPSNSTLLKGM